MYNFTIPMALMDFVPVVFFGSIAVLLLGALALHKAGLRDWTWEGETK